MTFTGFTEHDCGKMLSYLGFEAYDPPNMYQYSYAYDVSPALDGTTPVKIYTMLMTMESQWII